MAQTPNIDALNDKYSHAFLLTHGEKVGLPDGQMGNSEVGHMNLGAGRVVHQDLVKISNAISDKIIDKNQVLLEAFNYAEEQEKNVHFLNISDGGVHSHLDHLESLLEMVSKYNCPQVFVHGFTDGRDVDPKSAAVYLQKLFQKLDQTKAKLATITGRYYAMDRDKDGTGSKKLTTHWFTVKAPPPKILSKVLKLVTQKGLQTSLSNP